MEENNRLNIYDWWYRTDIDITILKDWLESQLKEGKTKLKLEISYGYYNDVDELNIIAE